MAQRGALTKEERDEALRLGHVMERLLATSEWQEFFLHAQGRIAQEHFKITQQPLTRLDDAFPAEFAKGTLKGIELTLSLPARMVEEMRVILDEMDTDE